MKRFVLMLMITAVFLPLTLATATPAVRIAGAQLDAHHRNAAMRATSADSTGIAAYAAAVQPAYAELTECACCCAALDLPSHRCAACRTAAATIERIVARIHRVQARLHRVDVPASLVIVHGELVSAVSTMHVSGEYMVATVLTTPEKLVVAERVTLGAPSGRPVVWRPSPRIVEDARVEALARSRPDGLSRSRFLHERYAPFAEERPSWPQGSPGEQAAAYLALWHDDLAAQARDAGLSLPTALAG
jgi:hypothetical protein